MFSAVGHRSTSVSAHNESKILERTHKRHELHLCTRTARVGRPTMDWKRIPNSTVTTIRAVTTLSTGEVFLRTQYIVRSFAAAPSGFPCPRNLKSIIKNGDAQRALNIVLPCELQTTGSKESMGQTPNFAFREPSVAVAMLAIFCPFHAMLVLAASFCWKQEYQSGIVSMPLSKLSLVSFQQAHHFLLLTLEQQAASSLSLNGLGQALDFFSCLIQHFLC